MKTLVIAALTVICFLCHDSAGSHASAEILSQCCETNTAKRVPIGKITHMGRTRNDCPLSSVIITTVCKRQICVDPEEHWVKLALEKFQMSTNNNNKTPSAPFNVSKCHRKR